MNMRITTTAIRITAVLFSASFSMDEVYPFGIQNFTVGKDDEPEKGKRQDQAFARKILALIVAKVIVELIVRVIFGQRG